MEAATGFALRHGEAVAVGLIYAAELAHALGRIDRPRVEEHRRVVGGYGLSTTIPDGLDPVGTRRWVCSGQEGDRRDHVCARRTNRGRVRSRRGPQATAAHTGDGHVSGPATQRGSGALPPLRQMDVPSRLDRVRAAMTDAHLDALWVTNPHNVRWLTGFTGSNGRLLLTVSDLVAVTDGRYAEQIANQLDGTGVVATIEVTVTEVGEVIRAQRRGWRVLVSRLSTSPSPPTAS